MTRSPILLILLPTVFGSFCGETTIPFSFETLSDGQPVLGCARPTCFGWKRDGTPLPFSASFFRINQKADGYIRHGNPSVKPFNIEDPKVFNSQNASCESTFQSFSCSSENQWVGGIAPLIDVQTNPTALQCCTYEPLRFSKEQGLATVRSGEIFIGGEVIEFNRQVAFDYISNVEKKFDDNNEVYYEVVVRRFPCSPLDEIAPIEGTAKVDQPILFQAPLLTQSGPIPLPFNEPLAVQPPISIENDIEPITEQIEVQNGTAEAPQQVPQEVPNTVPQPVLQQVPQQIPQPPYYYQPAQVNYYPNLPYFCFSADDHVLTISGEEKRMDELQVNDWVAAVDSDGVKYVPVESWLHRETNLDAVFHRFGLEDGTDLKITSHHYIYKGSCDSDEEEIASSMLPTDPVLAKDVNIGDCLFKHQNFNVKRVKVTKIDKVTSTGVFSPMTSSGTILVNNIHASCHTIIKHHLLQNTFFEYARYFQDLLTGAFGTSSEVAIPLGMSSVMSIAELVLPKTLF